MKRTVEPVHPGKFFKRRFMDRLNITLSETSAHVAIMEHVLEAIITGKAPVDNVTAEKLSRATKTTPGLWVNMQAEYDSWHLEIDLDQVMVLPGLDSA